MQVTEGNAAIDWYDYMQRKEVLLNDALYRERELHAAKRGFRPDTPLEELEHAVHRAHHAYFDFINEWHDKVEE